MPHINRVRINGISYNDGNNMIEDLVLNFNNESSTYEAINGAGKSFIMQCIMQPILPNSYLAKKQLFKDVFKGKNATQVAHVVVEWTLDENMSYKYLLTGFCARKKYAPEVVEKKNDEEFDDGSSSMDYFTYMIFYDSPHQYDVKHFPFYEKIDKVKTRVSYEKLKNNLNKYKKELPSTSKISIGIFGPKESLGVNEYKRNLAQYNILETEWSILKLINNGETNVSKFFESYQKSDAFILKFLIPEIIEKSYMWKTNTTYQDNEKLAATLLEIKDQLQELTVKSELAVEYEYMAKLINDLLKSNETLKALYEEKMTYEEKLCKVINYLEGQIQEYKGFVTLVENEFKLLEDKKKEIKRKQDALKIKENENNVKIENEKLESIKAKLNSKLGEQEALKEEIRFLYARNEYKTYSDELVAYEAKKLEIENSKKEFPELLENKDFYGNIYSEYLRKQILDDEDKLEELKTEFDDNSSEKAGLEEKKEVLIGKSGSLSAQIESLESSIIKDNETLDRIRPNLYYAQCFDFRSDLEQSSIKYNTLEEKITSITNEINEIPAKIKGYEGNKETAENSFEHYNEALRDKGKELEKYLDKRKEYRDIEQSFMVSAGAKLSEVINISMDECKHSMEMERNAIRLINSALENLNQQKPLSIHSELSSVFDKVKSVYSSAELGFDNVEEADDKEKLLSNNILVPYSIILSDSDFKAFSKNDTMRTSFGDIAIPILNREAVRGYVKLDIDFLQFSTKPLALFIDKNLLQKEKEKKAKLLELHTQKFSELEQNLVLFKKRYAIALTFENSYSLTFEEQLKGEIEEIEEKISKENEKILGFTGSIESLTTLLKSKQTERGYLINEKKALDGLIANLKKYIEIDDKLKIDEPKCEKLQEEKEAVDIEIKNITESVKKLSGLIDRLRGDIINLKDVVKKTKEDYNIVLSNINEKQLTLEQYKSVSLDNAKAEYLAANESLENKNADLKNSINIMQIHLENSNKAKESIEIRYEYNLEFFKDKEILFTKNEKFKELEIEKSNVDTVVNNINKDATSLKTKIEIHQGQINDLKVRYKQNHIIDYDDALFASIDDLIRYGRNLSNEMNKVESDLEKAKRLLDDYNGKIKNNESNLGKAMSIRQALKINYKTNDTDADAAFIEKCSEIIDATTIKINKIKDSFNEKVSEAKDKFATANISNFMQELNDLNAPSTLKEAQMQISIMSGEEGYVAQIQREKETIDDKIKVLLKIKDTFIETCAQRCDEVFNDLKKLQELSKIEIYGERKELIKVSAKNVPEEAQRRVSLSAYISKLLQEAESKSTSYAKEQYFKENLTLSNLFKVYFNNLERWDVSVYKVEELQLHSRYLPWSRAVGSSGQTNIIYLNIVICLISYIRKLYSSSSDDTKKVIFCDNPFGSSGAAYLYKPLMDLLERNKVQFICPGFNIPSSLLGLFKVNYQLGQELSPDGKVVLMVESVRGEKQDDNDDYYFSGTQLSLYDE